MSSIPINVFEVVGSPYCVASADGDKVHRRISRAIENSQSVEVSFNKVTTLTSAFLNTAIGQLYGKFDVNQIDALLSIVDMEQEDWILLDRVVDTAKLYFENPERLKQISKEILDGVA